MSGLESSFPRIVVVSASKLAVNETKAPAIVWAPLFLLNSDFFKQSGSDVIQFPPHNQSANTKVFALCVWTMEKELKRHNKNRLRGYCFDVVELLFSFYDAGSQS